MLYAVGGQAAAALPAAVPLVGADRFATARVVAEAVFDDPTAVGLASGINFPDGLSGGAHAGRLGAPLLLVRPDILPAQAAGYLTASASGTTVHVYGGRAAVGYTVTHEVDQLLTGGWVALAVSACSSARRPPGAPTGWSGRGGG